MGKYTPDGKKERETGRDESTHGHWSGAGERKEPGGGAGETDTERWTNGPSERRRREMTTERLSRRPPASSRLLPWIFGQQVRHLQLQRDEGTLCPGLSGRGPQLLLEAAPQDCPPSCGVPGSCLPGLPVGGQSGLPCWSLGAEGSQETSGKDPGSSPERGEEETSSHWGRETGTARGQVPGWRPPTDLGQRRGLSGVSSLLFPDF